MRLPEGDAVLTSLGVNSTITVVAGWLERPATGNPAGERFIVPGCTRHHERRATAIIPTSLDVPVVVQTMWFAGAVSGHSPGTVSTSSTRKPFQRSPLAM